MKRNIFFQASLIFLCLLTGCGRHDAVGYKKSVLYGEKTSKLVKDFKNISGENEVTNRISYYDGYGGSPTWNSKTKLHGRYIFTMRFPITINRWTKEFVRSGDPGFYIHEVIEVEFSKPDKYASRTRYGKQFIFSMDEWNKLVEKNGDFSEINIDLITDSPIDNFDRILR
ncbi:MAG: hypothetical protein MPJ24_08525 [Pirellulaceae bacterium]|nr:hypothetical protein [Pirellulaceae bacterium]